MNISGTKFGTIMKKITSGQAAKNVTYCVSGVVLLSFLDSDILHMKSATYKCFVSGFFSLGRTFFQDLASFLRIRDTTIADF